MKDWIIMVFILLSVLLFLYTVIRSRKLQVVLKNNDILEERVSELNSELEEEKYRNEVLQERLDELKRAEEKSRKLAMTDHVTGLPNRMAFTEMMDNVLKTLRKEENVAVMHIDVDGFKKVVEILGRSYGEELLIDVTDRLKQVMDENDFLACLGGDEFLILSQNIEEMGQYEEKVKKIRNVFSYPFVLATREVFVTLCAGIAFAPKDGKTTQTVFKNLDSALFRAKSKGTDSYCYYDEEISKELMGQIEMQSQIRSGIDNEEFVIYYQPQIHLNSKEIKGFETLLRWNHPAKGLLLPAEFLTIAEKAGLTVSIGKWMFEKICSQLKQWEEEGLGQVSVSMNLSGRQFADAGLADYVRGILEQFKVNPRQITMEITEEIALEDLDRTESTIAKLKEIGIGISLDKFGTGYASINYLKCLPLDNLKIDKMFMDELLEEDGNVDILEAIISIAKAFRFHVIVQGVESEIQENFLKKAECDLVQGFLYSEPLPKENVEKLLEMIKAGGKIEDCLWF